MLLLGGASIGERLTARFSFTLEHLHRRRNPAAALIAPFLQEKLHMAKSPGPK